MKIKFSDYSGARIGKGLKIVFVIAAIFLLVYNFDAKLNKLVIRTNDYKTGAYTIYK